MKGKKKHKTVVKVIKKIPHWTVDFDGLHFTLGATD